MREENASASENHNTQERQDQMGREKNEVSLTPPRLTFLAWGDFYTCTHFAHSTIPGLRKNGDYS